MSKKTLFVGVLFLFAVGFATNPAYAAITNWQKAASIVPRHSEDFASESFRQSLRDLKAANANTVSLIIPYNQSHCGSTDVQAGSHTPTDASLRSAITYARSIGLQVNLKPHVEAWDNWGGYCTWRANINPSDRATWFRNYDILLRKLASFGPDELTIGAELISLSSSRINADNTTYWRNIISGLRTSYPGVRLNYSANWGSGDFATETNQIQFWDALDSIGVSGYYEHWTPTDDPVSLTEIMQSWDRWNNSNIKPLNTQYGKPVKFTEVGYQSADDARHQPWNYDYRWFKGLDLDEQAKLYEALFQYWNGQEFFQGVNLWHWDSDPNAGGLGNTDYTPQNKPAEEVIRRYFQGGTLPTPPPPPPGPTPPPAAATFSSTATTSVNPTVNQPATITASVTNTTSSAVNSVLVDVELYNSSNTKIHQVFQESQNFTANQTRNYSFGWTPTSTGTYTIKVGVFNNSWSTNYHWNGEAGSFTVGSGTTTPPPPPPGPTPPPPTASCTNTAGTNLFNACYFDNMDLTGFKIERTETSVNNDWGAGSPHTSVGVDSFSAQWIGNFTFNAGNYNFTATSDDGIRVYIDNTLVLDQWADQPATTFNFGRSMTAGSHTVKVQYFENTGNAVAKVSWSPATTTPPPPPPPPGPTPPPPPPPTTSSIEVWWPSNGSTVSGVQPFQAILSNMDVSQYTMYWQVDGGTLNLMSNDSTGWPHKRSYVDVSGWTWRGSGPYRINFIARNAAGAVLAQKEISINVSQ